MAIQPVDKPFGTLRVPSGVEGLRAPSRVEGLDCFVARFCGLLAMTF